MPPSSPQSEGLQTLIRGRALRLKSLVRRALVASGLDVRRAHPASSPAARRQRLLATEDIRLVIDGGASVGEYAQALRAGGYAGRIVSFEPLPTSYRRLQQAAQRDPLWDCRNAALGDRQEQRVLHRSQNLVSSSLLSMTTTHRDADPRSAPVDDEVVTVECLDAVLPDLDGSDRVFLKLDLQGFELAALHGTGEALDRIVAIEVELSLVELYAGQPLFGEVLSFLADHGFVGVGLDPVMSDPDSGYLLQVDGLFLRSGSRDEPVQR